MDFRDKRVLVTGGLGCLGSHLAERLLSLGAWVTIYDNFTHGRENEKILGELRANPNSTRLEVLRADVLDFQALRKATEGKDYVFHFAALPSHRLALERPRDYALVDVVGTVNVLEACRLAESSPPVLFASSNKVYGKKSKPLREDMLLEPEGPYGQAKVCSEQWCRQYSKYYGLTIPVIRYHHVIGARTQPDREISIFTERIINDKPPIVHGSFVDGKFVSCAADYTHICDAIEGTLLITKVKGFDVFNLATGKLTEVLRIAQLVMDCLGKRLKPILKQMLPHESLVHKADITKIGRLGFEPKHSVEEAVKHYVEWRLRTGPREVSYR